MPHYHFTRISHNAKTGPIPVTTTSSDTCPSSCAFKGNGCYAEHGPLRLHWEQVNAGTRGGTLEALCKSIAALPKGQLWRMAQAGDWPGDGRRLDAPSMHALIRANEGRRGFGYTHYDSTLAINGRLIARANASGLTINLSANSLQHADKLVRQGIAPVVVVVASNVTKALRTPEGNFVAICPAAVRDDINCATCGVCAIAHRKAIIGFPAHGSGARKAEQVILFKPMTRRYDNAGRAAPRSAAVA